MVIDYVDLIARVLLGASKKYRQKKKWRKRRK